MKKFSNLYIFSFSAVMVVIVAVLLSVAAILLQPLQNRNIEVEKKRNILSSIHIESTGKDAETKYAEYITSGLVVNAKGELVGGENAFSIDLKVELKKPAEQMRLPVFIGTVPGGIKYIFPLYGKGLWGPIWGYIALNEDKNVIYGANFGHKGETPGLGAEINTPAFQQQFVGKKIFDETPDLVSITVVKSGLSQGNIHAVDAISGGTITSKGLEAMILDCLSLYKPFLSKAD